MTVDPALPPPPAPPDLQWASDKELRPTGGAAGAASLAALAWTVWNTTGSRVSLFLCMATLAVLAIDLVWAQVTTTRVRLRVTANPADAVVGDPVAVTLALEGPRQFLLVAVRSFHARHPPAAVDVPTSETLTGTATAREVLTEVVVEVVSRGLSGLIGCARRRRVPLAHPLAVGPRPIPATEPVPAPPRSSGEGTSRPAPTGDLVRSVRPYTPGDPARRVHWPATARFGDLVVKEVEDPEVPRLVIVLDLGPGGVAAERAAGRAAWYAYEGLGRGYEVVLGTAEGTRLVVDRVRSGSEINRRLAAAAPPGRPKVNVQGGGGGTILVTYRGDSWH